MGLHHKRDIYIKYAKRAFMALFVLCLVGFNAVRFCTDIRANNQFAYDYQAPEDLFMKYRAPAPMAVYSTIGKPAKTRLLVLPQARLKEADVLQNAVKTLRIYVAHHKMLLISATKQPSLQEAFPEAEVFFYGNTSVSALGPKLEKFLADENVMAVFVENLDTAEQSAGVQAVQAYAKAHRLRPRLFNMLMRTTVSQLEKQAAKPAQFDLTAQEQNLKQFLFDYEQALLSVLSGNPDDMPVALFDKAAVMAFEETPSGCVPVYGSPEKTEAFLDGVLHALKSASAEQGARLYVLTDLFQQEEASLQNLENVLEKGKDGVLIAYRGRRALMAPCRWADFADAESFLRALRLEAGLSPDFWADGIKVYLFRTVEVLKNGN